MTDNNQSQQNTGQDADFIAAQEELIQALKELEQELDEKTASQ